jgi:hypothetical protein
VNQNHPRGTLVIKALQLKEDLNAFRTILKFTTKKSREDLSNRP